MARYTRKVFLQTTDTASMERHPDSSSKSWFVLCKDVVHGPFSMDEVEGGVSKNLFQLTDLMWQKGTRKWVSLKSGLCAPPESRSPLNRSSQSNDWYLEALGQRQGPMTKEKLVSILKMHPTPHKVLMWRDPLPTWRRIHQLPELASTMGLHLRVFPRAQILGKIKFSDLEKPNFEAVDCTSISEAGIGVHDEVAGIPKEGVSAILESPLLIKPVEFSAVPAFRSNDGVTGLVFRKISNDGILIIRDYVHQFAEKFNEGQEPHSAREP